MHSLKNIANLNKIRFLAEYGKFLSELFSRVVWTDESH